MKYRYARALERIRAYIRASRLTELRLKEIDINDKLTRFHTFDTLKQMSYIYSTACALSYIHSTLHGVYASFYTDLFDIGESEGGVVAYIRMRDDPNTTNVSNEHSGYLYMSAGCIMSTKTEPLYDRYTEEIYLWGLCMLELCTGTTRMFTIREIVDTYDTYNMYDLLTERSDLSNKYPEALLSLLKECVGPRESRPRVCDILTTLRTIIFSEYGIIPDEAFVLRWKPHEHVCELMKEWAIKNLDCDQKIEIAKDVISNSNKAYGHNLREPLTGKNAAALVVPPGTTIAAALGLPVDSDGYIVMKNINDPTVLDIHFMQVWAMVKKTHSPEEQRKMHEKQWTCLEPLLSKCRPVVQETLSDLAQRVNNMTQDELCASNTLWESVKAKRKALALTMFDEELEIGLAKVEYLIAKLEKEG